MKNRFVQIALSLVLLGVLIQVVLVAPSQIRDGETKASMMPSPELGASGAKLAHDEMVTESKSADQIDQSMKGMHMIETQEGKKEWEISSETAVSLKSKELLKLEMVKAIFFSDSGVTFTVTGDRGLVHQNTKDLHIEGNVVTHSSNGYVFRTESMDYKSESRLLTAANAVDMVGPPDIKGHKLHLTGIGMKASLITSTMEVLNDVHAQKGLDDGRKALIRSHTSVFKGNDKTARFLGDVILDVDAMRITGPDALFVYDSKLDEVRTVEFTGGARVSDSEKWATSQDLTIDFVTNRFDFRGNPRVVQNNDELRGEEIIFLDGGKQVQVQRARATVDEKRLRPTKAPGKSGGPKL